MYNIYNKCPKKYIINQDWQGLFQNSIVKGVSASSLNDNKLSNVKYDKQEMILNVNNNEMKRNNNINPGNKIKDNDIGNCIKTLAGISQDFIIRGINKKTYPIQDKFEWENNPNLYIEKSTTNINDNDGKYTDTINIRNYLERIPPTNDIKNDSIKIFYGPLSLTTKYPSACSFAGTGMILGKEPLLGFMNPGINKIPLLVYNNDPNNIECQLKIHLFAINVLFKDGLYNYTDNLINISNLMIEDGIIINFKLKIFDSKHNRIREIAYYDNMYVSDNACEGFINFLKNDQNNSKNNNANYNIYDGRKSNAFDDNTASNINLDGALPYSKKNYSSLNINYNESRSIQEYLIKYKIFNKNKFYDSNITITFYYYNYTDNDAVNRWELKEIQHKCINKDIQRFDAVNPKELDSFDKLVLDLTGIMYYVIQEL